MDEFISGVAQGQLLVLITELQMGGAARVAHDQAQVFAPSFNVYEAVFNEANGVDFSSELPLISLGDAEAARPRILRPLFNLLHRVARLRELKSSLSIQLTISHLDGANRVSVLSGGRDAKILVAHGSLLNDKSQGPIRGFVARKISVPLLYNRADRVVAVSRDLAKELIALGVRSEKVSYINNFFDVDSIARAAQKALSGEERTIFKGSHTLVTIGRLHEHKNPLGLLAMFAQLRSRNLVKLVIVGDGPLREVTVRRSDDLGLKTYAVWRQDSLHEDYDVYLVGQKSNPFNYIASGTIFVLPSMQEGFPLALCEALACGVPAVSADCPTGPREILAPRTAVPKRPIRAEEESEFGVLLPLLGDQNAAKVWVGTLTRLLKDRRERSRLAEAGRIRVRDFTPEKIVPKWLSLIDEILRQRA